MVPTQNMFNMVHNYKAASHFSDENYRKILILFSSNYGICGFYYVHNFQAEHTKHTFFLYRFPVIPKYCVANATFK
jgi:hypothetical protein